MKFFSSMLVSTAVVLTGCAQMPEPGAITPLHGPVVQDSTTIYSDLLACVGNSIPDHQRKNIVITVQSIPDKTGKFNYNDEGYKVTQGAEDMVMSALAKTHAFTLVERMNMDIPKLEMDFADKYLLSDLDSSLNIIDEKGRKARALKSGTVIGSNYVIVGSISELNYNLGSGGFELNVKGWGAGWRAFWMDVGMDLRVINTRTTEIVQALPLRKQIWGYESKFGVVRFFGDTFVDGNVGNIRQEPIQLAVRSIIEGAVADITKSLYKLPDSTCDITKAKAEGYQYAAADDDSVEEDSGLLASDVGGESDGMRRTQYQQPQEETLTVVAQKSDDAKPVEQQPAVQQEAAQPISDKQKQQPEKPAVSPAKKQRGKVVKISPPQAPTKAIPAPSMVESTVDDSEPALDETAQAAQDDEGMMADNEFAVYEDSDDFDELDGFISSIDDDVQYHHMRDF